MPQRWRRHLVPLPWGRLSVQVAGAGPPMLLLHGLGGSGRYWEGLAPYLAATRTLIAPDLAGFGRSDKPDSEYSRDFHLDNLDGLLGAMNVGGRIDVAGHSMGGVLAALYAARRPERVASMALAAAPFPRRQTRPYGSPDGRVYRVLQRILPALSPLVRSKTFPRVVVADYLRHTRESYDRTSHALIWDVNVVDALQPLRSLDARRLLIFSAEDRTIAPDSLQLWQELLSGAEVRLAPGGHQLLLRGGFAVLAEWLVPPPASRVA